MSETITLAELTEVLARRHPDKPREAADRLARTLLAIRDGLDDFRQPQASGSTESAREASSSLGADRPAPSADVKPQAVPDAIVRDAAKAILAADVAWARDARMPVWQTLSSERAWVLAEAAAPAITAAERERIACHMEALASVSGGPSRHAYQNAAREIRGGAHDA